MDLSLDGRRGRAPRHDVGHVETPLQPVQPGMYAAGAVVGGRQQDARADQFQMQPGRGRPAHLHQTGRDHLGGTGEFARAQRRRLGTQPFGLVLGHIDEPGIDRVRHLGDDHQITHPLQQVLGEAARVLADLDHLVDPREHALAVSGGESVHDLVQQRVGGVAEQPGSLQVADPSVIGRTQQLIEHRQRIAHRPRTGTHHQRQHAPLDVDAFLTADLVQIGRQRARRHQPERIVVGARADRPDDLLGFGRREDELDVFGWLLDDLQQGVEALLGHHVRLVDDVDLVAAGHRREVDALA